MAATVPVAPVSVMLHMFSSTSQFYKYNGLLKIQPIAALRAFYDE